MARPVRGLPEGFVLDLPDDEPVLIGDFLDEVPQDIPIRRPQPVAATRVEQLVHASEIERFNKLREREAPLKPKVQPPKPTRFQLNLTPKSKRMFEELVEHVRVYSPEEDTRASEVLQAIITLLHNAKDDLDLAQLPRRGAWGSVTARNFPNALSEAFEAAILRGAMKRGA